MGDTCAFHNLYQVNKVPNNTGRILDLILSTDGNTIVTLRDEALVPADGYHPPLSFQIVKSLIHSNVSGPQKDIFYYDFRSADLSLLKDCLGQVNWDDLLLRQAKGLRWIAY